MESPVSYKATGLVDDLSSLVNCDSLLSFSVLGSDSPDVLPDDPADVLPSDPTDVLPSDPTDVLPSDPTDVLPSDPTDVFSMPPFDVPSELPGIQLSDHPDMEVSYPRDVLLSSSPAMLCHYPDGVFPSYIRDTLPSYYPYVALDIPDITDPLPADVPVLLTANIDGFSPPDEPVPIGDDFGNFPPPDLPVPFAADSSDLLLVDPPELLTFYSPELLTLYRPELLRVCPPEFLRVCPPELLTVYPPELLTVYSPDRLVSCRGDVLPSDPRDWDPEFGLDGLWKGPGDVTTAFLSFCNMIKPDAFPPEGLEVLFILRQRMDYSLRSFIEQPARFWIDIKHSISLAICGIIICPTVDDPLPITALGGVLAFTIDRFCGQFWTERKNCAGRAFRAVTEEADAVAPLLPVLLKCIDILQWLVPISDLLNALIFLAPSDTVLLAVSESYHIILQHDPNNYEHLYDIKLLTHLCAAISDACNEGVGRLPFSEALFNSILLFRTEDFNPEEALLFCTDITPVNYVRCITEIGGDVALSCCTFLNTIMLRSTADLDLFLSMISVEQLEAAIPPVNAFVGRLGLAILFSRLIVTHNDTLFLILLDSPVFQEIAELGPLDNFVPDDFADCARFHLVIVFHMIQIAIETKCEEAVFSALTLDLGFGSPINAIKLCSEARDVHLPVQPDSEDDSLSVFFVAEKIVEFVTSVSDFEFE
jgi:hypothetical protein